MTIQMNRFERDYHARAMKHLHNIVIRHRASKEGHGVPPEQLYGASMLLGCVAIAILVILIFGGVR